MDQVAGIVTRLSARLAQVAAFVPRDCTVADIGADHALLTVWLVATGTARRAIAVEVRPGPLAAARETVGRAGLTERIDVRLGDGLEPLSPGEADVVVLAGMGGHLICRILDHGLAKLHGVRRLIAQPNGGEAEVRRWWLEHRWKLVDEALVEEKRRFYEVLAAEPAVDAADAEMPYAAERCGRIQLDRELKLEMGPYLLKKGSHVFFAKWELERQKAARTAAAAARSGSPEARAAAERWAQRERRIAEVLACLRAERISSG